MADRVWDGCVARHLRDGAEAFAFYREFVQDNDIRCYRCAE